MARGWGYDVYTAKTKTCPICGGTMYEETKMVHDYSISTGKDYAIGTGKFYCPHCEEVAEQKAKEREQKEYEEKCKKYDKEYQEYLDIRQYDQLFNVQLTCDELHALRSLRGKQNRCSEFTIRSAYNEIDTATLIEWENTVTQKQRNCIKLIEKNTNHKFYGRTKESAKEFILKYIEESYLFKY